MGTTETMGVTTSHMIPTSRQQKGFSIFSCVEKDHEDPLYLASPTSVTINLVHRDDTTAEALPDMFTVECTTDAIGLTLQTAFLSGALCFSELNFGGLPLDVDRTWLEEGVEDGATISVRFTPWAPHRDRNFPIILEAIASDNDSPDSADTVAQGLFALASIASDESSAPQCIEYLQGREAFKTITTAMQRFHQSAAVQRSGCLCLSRLATAGSDGVKRALVAAGAVEA